MNEDKQVFSPVVRWALICFISVAVALMINVVGFFILLMFLKTDSDAMLMHYLFDTHRDFMLVTAGLFVLLLPFVRRIPFSVD